MANTPNEQQSEIKRLITKGREQGYLTYAEVNDHLPDDIVDPEQIEDIIGMINGMGIEVHEIAPEVGLLPEAAPTNEDDETAEQVLSLSQAQTRFARQVTLEVPQHQSAKTLSLLKELQPSFQPGPCALVLRYCHPEVEATIRLPDFLLDETLWDLLRARFGETALTLDYGSRPVNE